MLHINQRQKLYQFFAGLFANPAPELLQALASDEVNVVAGLLEVEVSTEFKSDWTEDELAELYTGLFVARMGGVPAPLYGSVYLDGGLLMGASTAKVAEFYREQGLSWNFSFFWLARKRLDLSNGIWPLPRRRRQVSLNF